MKFTLSVTWIPWQASVSGPARQEGQHNLFRDVDGKFERLPAVGETIYFDDGGYAKVESVTWKLDGTPFLFLGNRQERQGEGRELWASRGFEERAPVTQEIPPDKPA
jgi:hypothetical protein